MLNFVCPQVRGRRLFRYEEYWEDRDELPNFIQQHWSTNERGDLASKLSNISRFLEGWSKENFKKADVEIRRLKKKLQKLSSSHISEDMIREQQKCKEEITRLWEQEEKYWKARERLKWLNEGDRNSKFFHATTIQRRSRNRITRLRDAEGNWRSNQEELEGMAFDYFNDLFKSSNPLARPLLGYY